MWSSLHIQNHIKIWKAASTNANCVLRAPKLQQLKLTLSFEKDWNWGQIWGCCCSDSGTMKLPRYRNVALSGFLHPFKVKAVFKHFQGTFSSLSWTELAWERGHFHRPRRAHTHRCSCSQAPYESIDGASETLTGSSHLWLNHRSQPRRRSGTTEWSCQNTDLNPANHLWRSAPSKCETKIWKLRFRGSWSSDLRMDLLKYFHSWYEAVKRALTPSCGGLQPWNGERSAPRVALRCRSPIQSREQAWLMLIGCLDQEMCLLSMSLMAPTLLEWN